MSHRQLAAIIGVVVLFVYARPSLATEEPADTESPPPAQTEEKSEQPVPTEKPAATPVAVANPTPAVAPVSCPKLSCPKARIPVYIVDWGRLAELTASDEEVAPISKFWADRHDGTSRIQAAGTIIGTGSILFGTVNRLTTDSWTDMNKWTIAGGAAVLLVSALTSYLFAPDRDDFLTVINHWNLRHPDRPLAP